MRKKETSKIEILVYICTIKHPNWAHTTINLSTVHSRHKKLNYEKRVVVEIVYNERAAIYLAISYT